MPWWGSSQSKLDTTKVSVITDLTITPNELGRGSFGVVYEAVYKGKPCVVKEIHNFLIQHSGGHSSLQALYMEINTLSLLKHPSIVQFLGVHLKGGIPLLVMEKMWRNLASFLGGKQDNRLPLFVKVHILYDVICGLQYLHGQEKPIVHRDITANNVLLTENLEAKIGDLGLAKVVEPTLANPGQTLSTAPGNLSHMPPEATEHKPVYNETLDVFSFGCVTVHTVTEKFPTPTDQYKPSEKTFIKVSEIERRKEFLDELRNDSPCLHTLTLKCLQNDPTLRPAASWICNEFQMYITELETESPQITNYKQDKYSLVQSLQMYQSKEPDLEQKLHFTKAELEQLKLAYQHEKQEKDLLQSQLAEKEELVQDMKAKIERQNELCKETVQYSKDNLLKQSQFLLADCISMLSMEVKEKDTKIQQLEQKALILFTEVKDRDEKIQSETLLLSNKLKEKDNEVQKLESETVELGKIFTSERESLKHKILLLQQELSSSQRKVLSLQQTIKLLQEDDNDYDDDSNNNNDDDDDDDDNDYDNNDDDDNESFLSAVESLENLEDEFDKQVVPKFTAHPSNVIVNLESDTMSVSLTCEADGTTSYQWEREDGTIPSGATGVHTNTLTLVKLQSHDTGNYRCVASSENNISTPSKYATITIKDRSMIISISNSLWDNIIKEHPNMRKYINMDSLIPHLNKYGILTPAEREQLNMDIPCKQKVNLLLQFLESKSDKSILNFLKALEDAYEHTGHQQLLKRLKEQLPKAMCT